VANANWPVIGTFVFARNWLHLPRLLCSHH